MLVATSKSCASVSPPTTKFIVHSSTFQWRSQTFSSSRTRMNSWRWDMLGNIGSAILLQSLLELWQHQSTIRWRRASQSPARHRQRHSHRDPRSRKLAAAFIRHPKRLLRPSFNGLQDLVSITSEVILYLILPQRWWILSPSQYAESCHNTSDTLVVRVIDATGAEMVAKSRRIGNGIFVEDHGLDADEDL